jgi:hypothetical protein
MVNGMKQAKSLDDLKTKFSAAWKMLAKEPKLQQEIQAAYESVKTTFEGK